MKHIPFYPNTEDNMQCMVSIYRVLFEYYLQKKYDQAEMAAYVGYKEGRAAWSITPLVKMARLGFDIRMIEPFDYQEYLHKGESYLDEFYTSEEKAWNLDHTNILDIQQQIPAFLRTVSFEQRPATLEDIDSMLAEDRLVFVIVNSRALNGKNGYAAHALLILQGDAKNYIVHDPGPPATPYRQVSREDLWQAMGGEHNTAEVTGFIYRKAHIAKRLDSYVVAQKPRLSRAFAAKLIDQGRVLVNGVQKKPGFKLRDTDVVTISHDDSELDDIPSINLPIVYEDDDCLVINKPAGVLTHAQGHLITEATVATFLREHVQNMDGERAGIVHRLDRATSGLLICAKHPAALASLMKQFADREAKKTYLAIVSGHLKQQEAVIDMPIERNPKAPATFRVGPNGKPSVTKYKVLETNDTSSLVELQPRTGRTHQLRVHMAQLGTPIVGDPLYGSGVFTDRLYLHAYKLEITLPNNEHRIFEAPEPPEFKTYMMSHE